MITHSDPRFEVALSLVGSDFYLMLDAEPQRPGEDEVAAALRLLDRVLQAYPRAFDAVVADGLCAVGPVFNHIVQMVNQWHADHV